MRVLVLHEWYRDGVTSGENKVVMHESEVLRRAGHEVEVLGFDNADLDRHKPWEKVALLGQVISNPLWGRKVGQAIERFRPDVVHIHNIFPMMSPSVVRATSRAGVATVVTLHQYRLVCANQTLMRDGEQCTDCFGSRLQLPAIRNGCYRGSKVASVPASLHVSVNLRTWQTQPDLLLALSPAMRRIFLDAGFDGEQVAVKGNAVEDHAVPRRGLGDSIVYLARMAEVKGITMLMPAWEQVESLAAEHGVSLVLAGNGELDEQVAAWASTRPSVRFLGRQLPDACRELIADARAVAVPSRWPEPFGLAAVEAMCGSVPPICPSDGSFPDLVEHDATGLLYRQGSVDGLAAALRVAITEPDRMHALGAAARRRYEATWSPEANLAALEARYAQARDRRAARTR
jgi:glycosyltransferase involved in cell wall biosynthesis